MPRPARIGERRRSQRRSGKDRRAAVEREKEARRKLTAKEIIEDETRKYYESQMKSEEKNLRAEVRENLARIKAERRAFKDHQLAVLIRGSKEFREEFTGGLKLFHPTDPFKNVDTEAYLKKVRKNMQKYEEMVANAKRAGKAWENGLLLRKYQGTLNNLVGRKSEFTDKMNYKSLFEKIGKPFEKLCEITGLKRMGLLLNPGEFIRLPYLREYRADMAKMRNLALVKAIDLLESHKKNLLASTEALTNLERRKAAYYEELRRKAA